MQKWPCLHIFHFNYVSFVTVHHVWNMQRQYWTHIEKLVVSLCPLELIHTHWCSAGRHYPLPSDHSKARGTLGFITCPKRQFNALSAGVSRRLHNLLSHARMLQEKGDIFFLILLLYCVQMNLHVFICFRLHSNILSGCHGAVHVNLKLQLQPLLF